MLGPVVLEAADSLASSNFANALARAHRSLPCSTVRARKEGCLIASSPCRRANLACSQNQWRRIVTDDSEFEEDGKLSVGSITLKYPTERHACDGFTPPELLSSRGGNKALIPTAVYINAGQSSFPPNAAFTLPRMISPLGDVSWTRRIQAKFDAAKRAFWIVTPCALHALRICDVSWVVKRVSNWVQ